MFSLSITDHFAGSWWAVFGPLHFLALIAVFAALRSLNGMLKGDTKQSPALIVGLCVNAVIVSGLVGMFLIFGINHHALLGQ